MILVTYGRTLALALNLLFSPSPDAAPPNATSKLVVARDFRGVAVPAPDPVTGKIAAPFADRMVESS